jgi:hypothetical protein
VDSSSDLTGWRLALAAVRFVAELGMLAALAYVGWRIAAGNQGVAILLAVVLVAGAASVWGAFVSPRAAKRLEDPRRLAVEVVLFGAAVLGLLLSGEWVAALALGLAYGVSAPVGRWGY